MLEPNNFIPSWEAGDEEKKEVSNALRTLRVKYDQIFRLVMEKQHVLEQLKVKSLFYSRVRDIGKLFKLFSCRLFLLLGFRLIRLQIFATAMTLIVDRLIFNPLFFVLLYRKM